MDSTCWDGDANGPQAVIELPNGDVWLGDAAVPGGRRFRCHLGHVVEVLASGRIRRVGAGLRHARPWLLVDGPLDAVIERALADRADEVTPWLEASQAAPARLDDPASGLLARLARFATLWHRGTAAPAAEPAPAAPPWRDTMPWTHPR